MEITYQASAKLTYQHVIEKTEHFTFPSIRKKVLSMPIREPYYGVWATRDNKMLGMVLADNATDGVSELFSFYVLPEERGKGIGKNLLTVMETFLKKQGVRVVQSRFNSNWKNLEAIYKLLESNRWGKPVLTRIIAEIDIDKYYEVNWPEIKLASDYLLFQWEELSDADKKVIDISAKAGQIPGEFDPYQHEDRIYLPASLGLRHNEELIGWNIVYALKEDTIEYNNLFLLPDYRRAGLAIPLLYKSFGRQYEEKDVPKSTWIIYSDNKPVMKIFQRIASKHIHKFVETKVTGKELF